MKIFFVISFFLLNISINAMEEQNSIDAKKEEVIINVLNPIVPINALETQKESPKESKKEELLKKIYQQSELHIKHEDLSNIIDLVLNTTEESIVTVAPLQKSAKKWWKRCIPTKPCAALGLSTTHIFVTLGSSFLTWLVTFGSGYLITLSHPNSCNCTASS